MKKYVILLLTVFIAIAFYKVYGNNEESQKAPIKITTESISFPRSTIEGDVQRLKITFCEDLGRVSVMVKTIFGEVLYHSVADAKVGTIIITTLPETIEDFVVEVFNEIGMMLIIRM